MDQSTSNKDKEEHSPPPEGAARRRARPALRADRARGRRGLGGGNRSGWLSMAVWLPLVLTGSVVLFSAAFYRLEARRAERAALVQSGVRAEMFSRVLRDEVKSVAEHARILASGDSLRAYLDSGSREALGRAVRRAEFVSMLKPAFDQVRYIDARGMEVVRVDRGGTVVPEERLQDKSQRSYFSKGIQLEPGGIYISALDLNVENGIVERPLKPMFRVVVPVFDDAGARRGIYVINYLGERLFAEMQEIRPDLRGRLRVLNASGYWLKATSPEQEWGFMFPDRSDLTLAKSDPALWSRMIAEARGGVRAPDSLFSWQRIDLALQLGPRPELAVAEDKFLILALETSGGELDAIYANLRSVFATLTGLLVVAALVVGRLFFVRMQTNRALRRSEENLSVTLNSIGDAVLATDTAGRVTRMNPVAERLTGWSQAEAAARPVEEVLHIINESTREPAEIPVDSVLRTGETKGLANHTSLIARDGTERPIADSAAPIRGRSGRIVGVVLVFRDVSAERAAQRALAESEARYRTLFEEIDEGFCIIEVMFDPDGKPVDYRFLEINPSFERQTGLTDALGKRMRELAPDHEEHWFEIYGRIALTGESRRFQNRAEQLHRTYDVYAFRFGDPARRQVAILFNDITERDRTERQVARLNADLRLQAAQLGVANSELEAFSYSVSHDLRAPLRHVQGYVEMLARDSQEVLSEKSRRYLQTIAEAARDMGRLIDDLLSFSRMARAELREETIDMGALVAEVRRELAPATAGREILWKVHALPAVRGDEAMLKQVLANLLDNAVKYTRKRSAAEIEIGFADSGEGLVEFHVRDNGAGFDMKYADKLFGVFQRLHRTDEFEGTGIGLANVRRIIARHGGSTRAEGAVGGGATFYFSLFVAKAEAALGPHP